MATITMTVDEWNEEQLKRRTVEQERDRFRAELDVSRLANMEAAGVDARRLDRVTRAALLVARFAVANLPPEMTKGWPADDLEIVAKNLDALPTYAENDRDLANELLSFVAEIRQHEARRAGIAPKS